MGGAGLPWLVIVVVVAILALVGLLVFAPWLGKQQREATELTESRHRADVLAYEVPPGQDPAAVLAALSAADVAAQPDVGSDRHLVLIDARGGDAALRERAREAIAGAPLNTQGDPAPPRRVVFLDE